MIEQARLQLQSALDSQKTQSERNRLGQFATPTNLAREILACGVELLPHGSTIRFLDPAVGTGAFYSALVQSVLPGQIAKADGFDVDPHYALPTRELWQQSALTIHIQDFTTAVPPRDDHDKYNLLICNPPYVRHHHLQSQDKLRLQERSRLATGIKFSGLAGLYCYFLALAHEWMANDGVAGWLIPSEFMDVNYGDALKYYLLEKVTLLRIHRFEPHNIQFDDALVSSAIVWFRNSKPPTQHVIEFTFGGTLQKPKTTKFIPVSVLQQEAKWTKFPESSRANKQDTLTIGDLFTIKRGVATGDNKFFILTQDKIEKLGIPKQFVKPILPSPRYIVENEILANNQGVPCNIPIQFLLDCNLPEWELQQQYPTLWQYLSTGLGTVSSRYLCQHREPWYSQEQRLPSPIVCPYMYRSEGRSFRFILNNSLAIAPNVYLLLYPQKMLIDELQKEPKLIRRIWTQLNQIDMSHLIEGGRVYGGGLHKLEPKELSNIPATQLLEFQSLLPASKPKQIALF